MRPSARGGFISALLVIGAFAPARLRAEDRLLDEAKAGHRAARQAIRTFSASVVLELEFPQRRIMGSGRYWRVGDAVRIQEGKKEGVGIEDYLVKDGEIRQVRRSEWSGGRPGHHAARRRPATDFLCLCDVWFEMLIDLAGRGGGQVSYERWLEDSAESSPTKRERHDGREYVKVSRVKSTASGSEVRLVAWHDVGCNYLIRKLEVNYPKINRIANVTITEFAEPQPGVFVPLRARRESFLDGSKKSVRVTTLSDVRVNEPIPPASMALPTIPSGTVLDDTIQGTNGKVGADWRPIGTQEKALGRLQAPPEPASGTSTWTSPSTSEPATSGWWVTAVASGALALALGYMVVRRIRRASSKSV